MRAAAIAVVAFLAACSGGGNLPVVGRSDLCIEITDHCLARAKACGCSTCFVRYDKCDSSVALIVTDEQRATCLADVDALSCDKFGASPVLPDSCSKLFSGGL